MNENETVGSEQHPGRPAIIVSSDLGNEHSDNVTVVYLTTQEKRPMNVHVPVLCKVPATALCEQIVTVSKQRLGEYVRSCTDAEMQGIDAGILYALGLSVDTYKSYEDAETISELEATIGTMSARITDLKDRIADLEIEKAALQFENIELEEKLDKAEETNQVMANTNDVMFARLQAERDVYKGLFEQLQAKMMERGA